MEKFTVDIETLGTPENSGYGIVIPNYAVVKIPENLTSDLEWLYVQLPIQDQLDVGLKTDARTMDFWFNICSQQFPLALCEMQKSFTIDKAVIITNGKEPRTSTNVIHELQNFMGEPSFNTKIFGNGCHFDCSILQENHRILYGNSNLWHYSSPNNVRTLRLLMDEADEAIMKETVQPHLDDFIESVNDSGVMYNLCLHNPLFDAAKEALFVSFMLNYLSQE